MKTIDSPENNHFQQNLFETFQLILSFKCIGNNVCPHVGW